MGGIKGISLPSLSPNSNPSTSPPASLFIRLLLYFSVVIGPLDKASPAPRGGLHFIMWQKPWKIINQKRKWHNLHTYAHAKVSQKYRCLHTSNPDKTKTLHQQRGCTCQMESALRFVIWVRFPVTGAWDTACLILQGAPMSQMPRSLSPLVTEPEWSN